MIIYSTLNHNDLCGLTMSILRFCMSVKASLWSCHHLHFYGKTDINYYDVIRVDSKCTAYFSYAFIVVLFFSFSHSLSLFCKSLASLLSKHFCVDMVKHIIVCAMTCKRLFIFPLHSSLSHTVSQPVCLYGCLTQPLFLSACQYLCIYARKSHSPLISLLSIAIRKKV